MATPGRLTRGSGVRNVYDKVGLSPSNSGLVQYCQCDELCDDWKAHPLGRLMIGSEADQYNYERAEKEIQASGDQFSWARAKELIIGYRAAAAEFNNRPRRLIAQGQTACSLRTKCLISPVHFARYQNGICIGHINHPDLCVKMIETQKGENPAPFANLASWTPEARPFNWSYHYKWEPHQPHTPPIQNQPQTASPPNSDSTSPANSQRSATPFPTISAVAKLPSSASSSSVESTSTASSTRPSKRHKAARQNDRQPGPRADTVSERELELDSDLSQRVQAQVTVHQDQIAQLEQQIAAVRAHAQTVQLDRNVVKAKKAADEAWSARVEAGVEERMREADPSVRRVRLSELIGRLAAEEENGEGE